MRPSGITEFIFRAFFSEEKNCRNPGLGYCNPFHPVLQPFRARGPCLPQYLDFAGQTVTIEAGRTASETVTIGFKGLAGEGEDQAGAMEIDKTWLLPVRVTSDDMEVM